MHTRYTLIVIGDWASAENVGATRTLLTTVSLVAPTTSQPLVPPLRASSREPPVIGDGSDARRTGPSRGQDTAGAAQSQSLGVPGQAGERQAQSTAIGGDSANARSDSIGRGSKRSLTGRKRDASTGSKRAARAPATSNEKAAPPASPGTTPSSAPPNTKKKGSFLARLCCGASGDDKDEGAQEAAQAPKPVSKPPPTRAQQPVTARQQQDVSVPDTSVTDSKEPFDEKAPVSAPNKTTIVAPISSAAESEKAPPGEATTEKPVLNVPPQTTQNKPEIRPMQETRQPIVPVAPVTGPSYLDTPAAGNDEGISPGTNPDVQVQAPTPVVPQQSPEEQMITDRTPQQAAKDEDIEMRDADQHGGPSVPLTVTEAAVAGGGALAMEEAHRRHEESRKSSAASEAEKSIPPPPPGAPPKTEQQELTAGHDSTVHSQSTSIRDETQKWLLPPLRQEHRGRKCLVLDLDETLVHSSFKVCSYIPNAH